MIKVFICDDHNMVVEGIKLMLDDEPGIEFAGYCNNAEKLLELAGQNNLNCNIILLDINLPGQNGIDTCKVLKQQFPLYKIIALSMLKELSLVKLMLKNGAEGYLVKNAGKAELVAALKTIYSGENYIDEEIKKLLVADLTNDARQKKSSELIPSLSRREKEILQLIVEEYTTPEIAARLFISNGTVETHRRNMLTKIGARNTAGLVRMALEYKLID